MTLQHTIGYADLAATWAAGERDPRALPARQRAPIAETLIFHPDGGFSGCTAEEMHERIAHGYTAPGMDVQPGANTRPRRRLRFDEEGEIQVDLALSGHDTPFLAWGKRTRTPGLKLNVELAVRAATPTEVLADYSAWLTSLIAGMQSRGFDLEIDVISRAKSVGSRGENVDLNVRVKRFGRKSDLKSWGAIMAPGGFRRLVFLGRALACEAHGATLHSGMGASFGPSWGLEFDAQTRTLTVRCAAMTTRFPREEMDRQLAELKI